MKVILLLDNVRYHHTKSVKGLLESLKNISLKYIPPYSSELNSIEHLWKDIRKNVTHNHLFESIAEVIKASGKQIARNLYGINLLMRTVDGESYYYMYNGHADVTALVNAATGEVAATYYYDAFGNILESTGDVNNNITYAGYQYDEETGLYYLNARMYDPKIARFLQEDTYRGDPIDPLSLNLYAYCAYNPIMYYDPTGHNYIEIFGIPFGNPIEGIKTVFNKEKRKEAFEVIDLYMREDDQESNTKRIVRASVGTYKALKAIGEGGKDIAKSIFTPAATWIAFAGGEIYNWVTEKDEAFRQDFRELMWEEIYRIGDQDSLFKPLGNWIGYGGTIIYANITGQDREFKQILHEEALNEISRSGFAAIEAIQSPFKNTFNRQNASRYFQKAYYTPQEKLNEYATNMLVVGMIATGICSKANASGLKINVNFQNIAYGNGNLALATLPRISVSVSQSLPAASVGTMGNIMVVVANSGGFGGNSEIELPENTINAGKPGSPQWKDAVKTLRESKGKGINIKVENQADAHRLMKEAGLDLELKPTYTNEPYKAGYEVHPAEPNVGNNFPHIKWKDWTGGKSNGAEGHIFFER